MKVFQICAFLVLSVALVSLSSCGKKDHPVATVKFTSATATYAEDIGAINVGVTLSAVQSQDVTVNYTWTSPDTTAFLGADFTFDTPSSIVIPAGSTSANIQIEAIDDTQIDGDNNITLTLSSTSANAIVNKLSGANTFKLKITDNDVPPTTSLQIDLFWYAGSPTDNINNADLDLYLQDSVSYSTSGNQLTIDPNNFGQTFTSSTASSGFETLYLHPSDPDSTFFIMVAYAGGGGAVDYLIELNGMGRSGDYLSGAFAAADAPTSQGISLQFWGPFQKSADVFNFKTGRGRGTTPARLMKSTVLRFKVSDFKLKKK